MSIGVLFLFFGKKLFRAVIATTGFIFASLATYILLANVQEQYNFGPHQSLYTLIICCLVGFAGAALCLSMWMLALVGVGALAGFGIALYVLSWKPDFASHPIAKPALLSSLTVLGGALAIVYERALIISATSMIGAVALCSGIDVFAGTGFNESLQEFVRNKSSIHLNGGMYALLGSCAIVAFLGIVVQLAITGKPNKPK